VARTLFCGSPRYSSQGFIQSNIAMGYKRCRFEHIKYYAAGLRHVGYHGGTAECLHKAKDCQVTSRAWILHLQCYRRCTVSLRSVCYDSHGLFFDWPKHSRPKEWNHRKHWCRCCNIIGKSIANHGMSLQRDENGRAWTLYGNNETLSLFAHQWPGLLPEHCLNTKQFSRASRLRRRIYHAFHWNAAAMACILHSGRLPQLAFSSSPIMLETW
jgi:hypothetical protein